MAANVLVLAIIVALIFSQIDVSDLLSTVSRADLGKLLLAAFLYASIYVLTGWRIKLIAASFSCALSLVDAIGAHASSILLSDVTPGRVGYTYIGIALKRKGLGTAQSARLLGISLASDFIIRALSLLALSLFVAPLLFGPNLWIAVAVSAATMAGMLLFLSRSRRLKSLIGRIPQVGTRLARTYDDMLSKKFPSRLLFISVLFSAIGTAIRGLEWLVIFSAIAPLPVTVSNALVFTALVAALTGLSFLPISIAGFGVQESVGAVAFSTLFGLPITTAIAGMLLARALEVAVDLSGLAWLKWF